MYFIGDVHGKFEQYHNIIKDIPQSLQLGDMGIGFSIGQPHEKKQNNHLFLRGNHDNPFLCKKNKHCLFDYGIVNEYTFFISGAESIDKHLRTEGVNWWEEEELTYSQLEKAIDECIKIQPFIIATHCCPSSIFSKIGIQSLKAPSVTEQALNILYKEYQPDTWVFGHHHRSIDIEINKTRFVCLNELEVKKL